MIEEDLVGKTGDEREGVGVEADELHEVVEDDLLLLMVKALFYGFFRDYDDTLRKT